MPHQTQHETATEQGPPHNVRSLGPGVPYLFAAMHISSALRSLEAGMLPTTRAALADPDPRIVGDPRVVRERLMRPMQAPHFGRIADYASLTFTPRSPAVYGSCGPVPAQGAERILLGDIVIAVISLDDLLRSGLLAVFCDRLAVRPDAAMFSGARLDLLPWDAIRGSRFGAQVEALKRARYNSEMLIWGGLPIAAGVRFACVDANAADAFAKAAAGLGIGIDEVLLRPHWGFRH